MASSGHEDHRRKWDKDDYERLATRRIQAEYDAEERRQHPQPPVQREFLRKRDYKVDLESRVGKSSLITKATPQSQTGGYFCDVCDCVVKDSMNFLDHINGKKHQKILGMSMRIERSTLDQVKKRFQMNKLKREETPREYKLDERVRELEEEQEKAKEARREKRMEKKRKAQEALEEEFPEDPEMASIMGFGGFGSSKR